jgi:glycosyltransferase involved in cell wall biosynthesis
VHIHGIENPGFIQKLLIKRVPEFIAVSDYIKNDLINNGYPKERMAVIPNPVCPKTVSQEQTSELRKHYGINDNEQVLGIVGRIIRWKGHIEFLMAASLVMRTVPRLKVMIVGEFTSGNSLYRNEITRMVEDSGCKDRVIFTGYVSDVERYYSLMDVCVHASIEPEPFGLVITEAMACGVPVIASDLGAPREIITDGENGFLVNPKETEKLAEIIIRILKDDALRSRIGARGKDHVLKNYQVGAFAHSMEQLYMNVLEKKCIVADGLE